MSRSFTAASSQYLENTSTPPVTAVPLTISAWVKWTSATTTAVSICKSTSNTDYFQLIVSTFVQAQSRDATTNNTASAAAPTANAWIHAAAVFTTNGAAQAFTNGVGGSVASTNTVTPSGLNRMGIGVLDRSSRTQYMNGLIAHAAVWNVALSAEEIAALYGGADPRTIQFSALVNYVPLTNGDDPETDTQQVSTFSLVNSPTFDSDNGPSGRNPYVQKSRVGASVTRAAVY